MHIFEYYINFGQILTMIAIGLITTTLYNKLISPAISKIFDFTSKITNFTKKIRMINIQKSIDFCASCECPIRTITIQNRINHELIISGIILTNIFLFFIYYAVSEIYNNTPVSFRPFIFQLDHTLFNNNVNRWFTEILIFLSPFIILYIFFRIIALNNKSICASNPKENIKILNERLEKLRK